MFLAGKIVWMNAAESFEWPTETTDDEATASQEFAPRFRPRMLDPAAADAIFGSSDDDSDGSSSENNCAIDGVTSGLEVEREAPVIPPIADTADTRSESALAAFISQRRELSARDIAALEALLTDEVMRVWVFGG